MKQNAVAGLARLDQYQRVQVGVGRDCQCFGQTRADVTNDSALSPSAWGPSR
jgi:hypothetical protein